MLIQMVKGVLWSMAGRAIRNFALGVLVTSSILAMVYFWGSGPAESTAKFSEADAKSLLEDEGYVIHTKEEWEVQVAALNAVDNQAKKDAADKDADKAAADKKADKAAKDAAAKKKAKEAEEKKAAEAEKAKEPEKEIHRLTLVVASGMYTGDVAKALADAKIVPNAFEFSQLVESRGLASALRPGTYEISSEMTIDEIIAAIFKQ